MSAVRNWRLYGPKHTYFQRGWSAWSDSVWMATFWHSMAEHRMRYIRCHNKRSVPPPFRLTPHTAQIPTSPEREREKKNHTHTREKKSTCKTFWASRIKHTEWKLPVNVRFVACFSSSSSFPFLSLLINFIVRRLFEVFACFNASCCCAKTWDLHLSAASPEGALRLEAFSMDFTDGFPDWSVAAGNTRPLNLDLFHLNGGLKVSRAR